MEPFYPAQVFAAAWALQLEEYMKHFQAGVPFLALRYNELVADKAGSTTALLQHCGLSTDALPEILKSFEQDSQEGSGIGQDNKVEGFKPKDYQCFVDTLANHPHFHSPDVILPDVYHRQ